MNQTQSALYTRLREFQFDVDAGDALTFADRLRRENGWSRAFTERVIEEYRRFILLAATAEHPVTPSDAVDQAWHLHLVYTRSYWQDLCGQTLGKPLHHGPTRGGASERDKFTDWYTRTLQTYRRVFAEDPPREIWPTVEDRFAEQSFVRIDCRRYWLFPKKLFAHWLPATVLLVATALVCMSCTSRASTGPVTVFAAVAAAGLVIIVLAMFVRRGKGGSGSGCGAGCGFGHSGCGSSGCGGSGCGGGGCGGGCGS